MQYLKEYDANGDNVLSYQEFKGLAEWITAKHSVLKVFLAHLDEVFDRYDKDHNGTLDLEEIRAFLLDAETRITALPAVSNLVAHLDHLARSNTNIDPEFLFLTEDCTGGQPTGQVCWNSHQYSARD